MKNLVIVLILFAAGTVSLGLNRGWFTVNQQKIEQDEEAAKIKMRDLGQTVQENASDLKGSANDQK